MDKRSVIAKKYIINVKFIIPNRENLKSLYKNMETCHECCGLLRCCDYEMVCTQCGLVSKIQMYNSTYEPLNVYNCSNQTIQKMVHSLQFDDGKVENIVQLLEHYKQLANVTKIGNMQLYVCSALVFDTKYTNLHKYCQHFGLQPFKVGKVVHELYTTFGVTLSRYDLIISEVLDLCATFNVDYTTLPNIPANVANICSGERNIAAAFVHVHAGILCKDLADILDVSVPAIHKCINILTSHKA
jgi:hypothetical protein